MQLHFFARGVEKVDVSSLDRDFRKRVGGNIRNVAIAVARFESELGEIDHVFGFDGEVGCVFFTQQF